MQETIIINATALNSSGALSILNQFVDSTPETAYDYIFFINSSIEFPPEKKNIKYVRIKIKSLIKRVLWDAFGVKKWLKRHGIVPVATISLQNTNFRTQKSIPNFVYYHQSIPFFEANWNPLVSSERELWFYKNIYPFFVKLLINRNTEFFVQTNVVRSDLSNYCKVPKERIHTIPPRIEMPTLHVEGHIALDKTRLNLFYPATPFIYKNHEIVLKALSLIDAELQKNITLHLTCESEELKFDRSGNHSFFQINFMGVIPFEKVLGMYQDADALLFPSYIETIGLPLVEAASFGMPIIVADLPYSREVLRNYEGASFAKYNDAQLWKREISKLFIDKGKKNKPIRIDEAGSWEELFRIIKDKIQQHV